ncbi:MAG: tetratricopeptide repeat protein [Burkholderiales bacterium]|nr:tetratricopeptide repeat protein [Burkholderiales bacterium]
MPSPRAHPSAAAVGGVLEALLSDCREGRLGLWPRAHPRLCAWLAARELAPALDTLADALPAEQSHALAMQLALGAVLSRLRPDGGTGFESIDEDAWVARTSWRPFLALACHCGLLPVPAFSGRYRRGPDESPADNLCGLWSVGASTFYRYVDKGKRQLADTLLERPPAPERLRLREAATSHLHDGPAPAQGWPAWHGAQATAALQRGRVASALWHGLCAGDIGLVLRALEHDTLTAANVPEVMALLQRVEQSMSLTPGQQVLMALGRADVWRHHGNEEQELSHLQQALRLAHAHPAAGQLARVFLALGRFHESRDADRSLACFEDAVREAQPSTESPADTQTAAAQQATAYVRMAWLHMRRNDPRARDLLDRAERLRHAARLPDDVLGDVEQTWGEYWRRAGELRRALEHQQRALNIAQRRGHRRSELTAYLNLSLLYGETREFGRATEYGERVLEAARHLAVEPEMLVCAHGNLGVAYYFEGRYDDAIRAYRASLALAERADLRSRLGVTHYNLAEAHYKRFQHGGDPADEQAGDRHAGIAMRIAAEDGSAGLVEAGRTLKREVLGETGSIDRLLPGEHAAHFEEMAEVDRLRRQLAVPAPAADRARLHLDIARHYATIAAREREAALALLAPHGVTPDLAGAVEAVRRAFERGLTREQRLAQDWQQAAHDLLAEGRRQAVLAHLLAHGSIQKSAYAEVAQVSLATASKHLGLLAERGLLLQTGKGPSTRYLAVDRAETASSR